MAGCARRFSHLGKRIHRPGVRVLMARRQKRWFKFRKRKVSPGSVCHSERPRRPGRGELSRTTLLCPSACSVRFGPLRPFKFEFQRPYSAPARGAETTRRGPPRLPVTWLCPARRFPWVAGWLSPSHPSPGGRGGGGRCGAAYPLGASGPRPHPKRSHSLPGEIDLLKPRGSWTFSPSFILI